MPPKTSENKKAKKQSTVVDEPNVDTLKIDIEESEPEKVIEEPIVLEKEDSEEEDIQSDVNDNEGIISSTEYIKLINQQIEIIKKTTKALKSIQFFTKTELKEVDKAEKLLQKAREQLAKELTKVFFSLAANSAPKAKKNNLDENGNKIPTPGKSPCIWYEFARTAFSLESNEGFKSTFLTLIWPFLRSEEGVKNGPSITISNPGRVNNFFNEIKRVMEERGLNEENQAVYDLINKGVLVNTDITKFSKYCCEETKNENEKKPKAIKKSKAK
jgi:predicted RND superfamily exporter protein